MKSLVVGCVVVVAVLGLSAVRGQGTGAVSPGVTSATAGPEGFIVVKGVIYEVRQGRATVLPDSLRLTGTVRGVKGFARSIQQVQPGFMLTNEGLITQAPAGIVFGNTAMGAIAPSTDTSNAVDNSIERGTDSSVDRSLERGTDQSVDNRTTRATNNATDNRTTRSTNNAVDNSTTNGTRR